MPSQNELTSSTPDSQLPQLVNSSVMNMVWTAAETAYQLHDQLEHGHLSLRSTQRFSEEGGFVSYELAAELTLCPNGRCGAPDDAGIPAFSQWLSGRERRIQGHPALRSDEQMASAAIQSVIPTARIEKLTESQGPSADFLVHLSDQSRALVEVTMHTDPGRRRLRNARDRPTNAALKHDWHIWIRDQRFPGDYGQEQSFPLNEVRKIVAGALNRLEQEGADLDQVADVERHCEQEIDREWRWSRAQQLEDTPPLGVTVVSRQPAQTGRGRLELKPSTAISHFSGVTETSAVVSAAQACIERKLAKSQWGDATDEKWLVVVLDEGEAATQLRGVEEFEDEELDFGGITFPGLDEVWVVAFDEGKFTVLRCDKGNPGWRLHRGVEAVTYSDTD